MKKNRAGVDRRRLLGFGGAVAAGLAAPSIARGQTPIVWKMATAWPKDGRGGGANARRLADWITSLSGGRLKVEVFAAGDILNFGCNFTPAGSFDLVSAQFLHSTVHLERRQILKQASAAVAPGGTLLIVDPGEAPPWAAKHVHDHHFQSADEVVAELDLPEQSWQSQHVGTLEREAIGPTGESAILRDNLIVLRRTH